MDYTTLQGDNLNDFIQNYTDALNLQKEADTATVEQNRENAYAGIMGAANTAGMMYSNIPARSKIRYDTATYYPSLTSVQSTYQTGLDDLRNNAVSLYNTAKQYEEAIANLNASTASSSNNNSNNNSNKSALNYTGNADYRGWLQYLADNGDTSAQTLLNYAGNDGGVSDSTMKDQNNTYWNTYQALLNQ